MVCICMGFIQPVYAMEIIFGQKYPIQQKTNSDQLAWLSVQFEKDITGKVIYRLEASHPKGKKISYLKGRDYLLSEDMQKNMIRNFEVKNPEVDFDIEQKAYFEVTLPYDFNTRYLPLKFETEKGYQEVVLRLRFGDYRFMLASRVLNSVSFVETEPVIAAKTVDQLFAKRELLKKRPPKLIEKQEIVEVKVDDIYDVISKDLNIQTRIISDDAKAAAQDTQPAEMDEFDTLLSKYAIDENKAKSVTNPSQGMKINPQQLNSFTSNTSSTDGNLDTSNLSPEEQEILNKPTTESDYNAYVDDLVKEKKPGDFDGAASIDEIIAQAGQFDSAEQAAAIIKTSDDIESEDVDNEQDLSANDRSDEMANQFENISNTNETTGFNRAFKPKAVYIPPVDTEELFGLPSQDWVEPKSAPVLVMKPKPVDQKRRIASFDKPQRNNFVEWTPAPKPAAAKGVNIDELFGADPEANSSGFGF